MIFSNDQFHAGDWVIYRKHKSSTSPGPRAENVHAAQKGNLYRYTVDKFWVVEGLEEDGQLRLRTRRGKRHSVDASDPALRKAKVWERWIYRTRFEVSDLSAEDANDLADDVSEGSQGTRPADATSETSDGEGVASGDSRRS